MFNVMSLLGWHGKKVGPKRLIELEKKEKLKNERMEEIIMRAI